MKSFIETQFPISRLSADTRKERNAGASQTLTGLGKWWGRKPLILVRASILGMLMPASADAQKDREVFLKLLTMDDEGVWRRRKDDRIVRSDFDQMAYAERIHSCVRPEHLEGPDAVAWVEINAHLGTTAKSLTELVEQLGIKRFGHRPRVGDCFAGGGSIPFEAARIGCEAFGSDLNPVAALLTWASLNLVGGGKEVQTQAREAQEKAFAAAKAQIEAWGIERSEEGWQAEAYLYCVEVQPQELPYAIPLAPSWVISEKYRVCAVPKLSVDGTRVELDIVEDASDRIWLKTKSGETGTVKSSRALDPFDSTHSWSIESLRGPEGLRLWEMNDLVPRSGDVFQERLYCIRWRKPDGTRAYRAPTTAFDLSNEAKVLELLKEKLVEWWEQGFVPSLNIPESGVETDRLFRERGWTHWHHLFTPRQLLMMGNYLSAAVAKHQESWRLAVASISISCAADRLSRLCGLDPHASKGPGSTRNVFFNQALNTQVSFASRAMDGMQTFFSPALPSEKQFSCAGVIQNRDARDVKSIMDLWITDPPYADAINYNELADFFLAWYEKLLPKAFPEWVPDGRKALAVRGTGDNFRKSMVEIYSNLCKHMPENGLQMVQFTHQNPAVWADLGMILWAAGLRVTAAWTVSTEKEAGGIKDGNYVQGTVLLVLRKRTEGEPGFLDEVYPLVEDEVKRQIDSMRALDEGNEPNFGDTDYQLAAYAAALRVLTQYQTLDGQDIKHELFRVRPTGRKAVVEKSRFEQVIDRAVTIACDYLVPRGLDSIWRDLNAHERLYLRSLDVESRGEHRQGVYQELARGFGVSEYKNLLSSSKANGTRIACATEFGRKDLGGEGFAGTALRHLLYAVFATARDESPEGGLRYLKDELKDYWTLRQRLIALLDWLVPLAQVEGMEHWLKDSAAAQLLAGRLRNDHG